MTYSEHLLPRRSLIKGAGLGLVAGALGEVVPPPATAAESEIWSQEYWAKKGDVPLWMYRKRLGAPKQGEPARPIVFFVHGSSVTSRAFDLTVPGKGEYSVMNEFARYGFDCWTMDHENYGKSGRTSGNCRPPTCRNRPSPTGSWGSGCISARAAGVSAGGRVGTAKRSGP